MEITLPRFAYTPSETQGILRVGGWTCFTIERPWLRWTYPGGQPFESCIPEGTYDLLPYIRRNGDKALAMVNPDLGVYFRKVDRPTDNQGNRLGRFKCLIHGRANYVTDVQGCAATGESRVIDPDKNKLMVTNSTVTMTELLSRVGWETGHTIRIYQAPGAIDTPLVTL